MSTMSAEPIGTGWRRADGRVGLRNHVVALSTVGLTDRLTALATEAVPDTLALTPAFERGLRGRDVELQTRVLDGVVNHPNVGAVLLVAQDRAAAVALRARHAALGERMRVVALMEHRGYDAACAACIEALHTLSRVAERAVRSPVALSDLCVALECGGSDASSSVCANPAIGTFVDRVVAAGGTAVVSETAEFIGAEAVIRERADSSTVAEAVLARIARVETMMKEDGTDYRGVNPTQENIEAGLTTLVEKTMGAVCKIGTGTLDGCLDYAEAPSRPGLHFMDTPFFSPVSLTGMVAGGCQLVLFGMGVFNPSANPLAPTLKVCGNPHTLTDWGEEIDVDVSGVIDGSLDRKGAGDALARAVSKVVAGAPTRSERRGEGQLLVPRSLPSL